MLSSIWITNETKCPPLCQNLPGICISAIILPFYKTPNTHSVKNTLIFCPGSYLPLSLAHCCLLMLPWVWVIVITFSGLPNHLSSTNTSSSQGKSNMGKRTNPPCLPKSTWKKFSTWPFVNFRMCLLCSWKY